MPIHILKAHKLAGLPECQHGDDGRLVLAASRQPVTAVALQAPRCRRQALSDHGSGACDLTHAADGLAGAREAGEARELSR